MTFINKYNKANFEYKYSNQIGSSNYGVGCLNNNFGSSIQGLITKTDLNGQLVWEKSYTSNDGKGLIFEKVIRCEYNDDIIVLAVTADLNEYQLCRIDTNGDVVWRNYYPTTIGPEIKHHAFLTKRKEESYILVIRDQYTNSIGQVYQVDNIIMIIGGSGNIIDSKNLTNSGDEIYIHNICSDGDNLLLVGHQVVANIGKVGVMVKLDENINVINKFALKDMQTVFITDVVIDQATFINNHLILSGIKKNGTVSSNFVTKLSLDNIPATGSHSVTINPEQIGGSVCNSAYIYCNGSATGVPNVVLKYDHLFNLIWSKKFDSPANLHLNQVTSNSLILHGTNNEEFLGKVNLDIDSCKTSNIQIATPGSFDLFFDADPVFQINNFTVSPNDTNIIAGQVVSVIEELCPIVLTIPEFIQVNPICSGVQLAALPMTSTNGISGTWSPAVNNLATTTYTFTPTPGQNATIAVMTIVVYPMVTPTFSLVGPINAGDFLATLPTTSVEGISGSWSPAIDNSQTTTYTFTPAAGICAYNAQMTIVVVPVPCMKDNNICELYSQLQFITGNCFIDPGQLPSNNDFNVQKTCGSDFLDEFTSFSVLNTSYNLPNLFQNQLQDIDSFLSNQITATYILAWHAVDSILTSLSQMGNCNCENDFEFTDNASIQSSNLYLQAAGSTGGDSTVGIHLRWALKGGLLSHLPKANYAQSFVNFNKNEDFVKIYRTKYIPYKILLNFDNNPLQVNETINAKNWVYEVSGKVFFVHFRDIVRYNQVRSSINPAIDATGFIENYGNFLIEVEHKTELSFAIKPTFILSQNSSVKIELLSVEENKITAHRGATLRKEYTGVQINTTKLFSENIRSIRFKSENSYVHQLEFEFYSDFLEFTNNIFGWKFLGRYALTKDANVAFQRLEPQPGCLSNWLRYNDKAFVNVNNYKEKWNGVSIPAENRILEVVNTYIDLSDSASNPIANETVSIHNAAAVAACIAENPNFNPNTDPGTSHSFEISNLHLLQMASLDFHVARMLGLGLLDLENLPDQYIYLAEYTSNGDLGDGLGRRVVQHLYCSLPTGKSDQRLPLPIDLNAPIPGIFYNFDESIQVQENEQLTIDGYSEDGKTRYYTLTNIPLPEENLDADFYYNNAEFISSELTIPVFAGIEYKKHSENDWRKPELSFDNLFFNIDSTIPNNQKQETKNILIPDAGRPLYLHREKNSGIHVYSSYGINWFSRAKGSTITHMVETVLRPVNNLLPPTNINATLIQKESPLLLTTSSEQTRYINNTETDKTLVRLTFEYNHAQELIDYHQKINGELIKDYSETDDDKEIFAEDIIIFFRNHIPISVFGGIQSVTSGINQVLLVIQTGPFTVPSTAGAPSNSETYIPSIPLGAEDNFIGSIMLVDDKEYVVHQVDNSGTYPKFTIFKSDVSGAMVHLDTVIDPNNPLASPQMGSMFLMVENMLNIDSWGTTNPSTFKVNIDRRTVFREDEILIKNMDCSLETHVQKFRGIYESANIEKVLEKVDENNDGIYDTVPDGDSDPNNDVLIQKHLGLYKITFDNFDLAQHSQFSLNGNSVEWYNGIVRLHTLSTIGNEPRKNFKVVRTENIGAGIGNNLILYVLDLTFPNNAADLATYKGKLMADGVFSTPQKIVNYYPGYKVYLYENSDFGLNEVNVLPEGNEDVRYTMFGLQSHDLPNEHTYDNTIDYYSKMSVPAIMFAQAIVEPMQPQKPTGGLYATRPDYYGKSSYTFKTKFDHKPHSVQFNRASDIQFLASLYDNTVVYDSNNIQVPKTLQHVITNIFLDGEEDFFVDRWQNLLGFNYDNTSTPQDPAFPDNPGQFRYFEGRRLPMPDNHSFIDSINAFIVGHNNFYNNLPSIVPQILVINSLHQVVIPIEFLPSGAVRNNQLLVKDFLKEILLNCFVPLTEVPVIYNYIKGQTAFFPDYVPLPKKQVVRDRNGNLLRPTDTEFDMAPMMKIVGVNETQFTDFGIDGASNAKYFYAVREINIQLKTSDYSSITGPISLVNTAPPTAPEIIKIIPVLENRTLGINPCIQLQINAYSKTHHIRKINIYRSLNAIDSLSIRTMKLIKVIDLEVSLLIDESIWVFEDDFSDLAQVPFGDPLYYRISVSRAIKYNDKDGALILDYTPSEASRMVLTNIVENYSPETPILQYYSQPVLPNGDLNFITFKWEENVYKGNYHLYKMNSQGNWVAIAKINSDRIENGRYYVQNLNSSNLWVDVYTLEALNNNIYLPLEMTNLNVSSLSTISADGAPIYHHFKIVSENTAGMFSLQENIVSMYNLDSWNDVGGIGDMIIEATFIVL